MQHGPSTMASINVTDDIKARTATGPTNTTLLMQPHSCLSAGQSHGCHLVDGSQCFIIGTVKAAEQMHGCLALATHRLLDSREAHMDTHIQFQI